MFRFREIKDLYAFNFKKGDLLERAFKESLENRTVWINDSLFRGSKNCSLYLRNSIASFLKDYREKIKFIPKDYSEAKALYIEQTELGALETTNNLKIGDWVTPKFKSYTICDDIKVKYWNNFDGFGYFNKAERIANIKDDTVILEDRESFHFRQLVISSEEEIEKTLNLIVEKSYN